jgi:hypothetical protein
MQCPGQDTRYWKPGDIFDIDCPQCGHKVEFFKDEATRTCRNCKTKVVNPRMNFGCASYCQYAAQCLGDLGPELLAKRQDLLKDRVAVEVKRQLGKDFHTIAHAANVARSVEKMAGELKAEPAILLCAAYLHVLAESEDEASRLAGRQKVLDILQRIGTPPELTEKVRGIIDGFLSGEAGATGDVKVFFDAHHLASLEEEKHNA